MAEEKAPKYEKAMSRLAEEALKEDEQRDKKKQRSEVPKEAEKKNLVRGSVDDYTPEDWEQVAKKVRFSEKGEAFVPSSSSTAGSEKRPASEVPTGERDSKFSHMEPARGSMRASMSTTVSQAKKLKIDNLGSATVDLNGQLEDMISLVSCVLSQRWNVVTCLH